MTSVVSYTVRAVLNRLVPNSLTFHTGTLTANSVGTAHEVRRYIEGNILVDVTAVGGTPSITLTVETSDDNITYFTRDTFPAITAVGRTMRPLSSNLGRFMRVSAVVTGSITLTVRGDFKV